MARAYKLLVGLTEIDSLSSYYSRHMPGFTGREGCEGCQRDVELMDRLSHYHGFVGITPEPLVNATATLRGVLARLEAAASVMEAGDIFLFYLSSHGRSLVRAPVGERKISLTRDINAFLLYDHPVLNEQLVEALARFPAGCRIVTILDCCHAGLGAGLVAPIEDLLQERILSQDVHQRAASPGLTGFSTEQIQQKAVVLLKHAVEGMQASLVHFGAAKSEGTAAGGPDGSLFTRRWNSLMWAGGDSLTYRGFLEALSDRLPPLRQPAFEWVADGGSGDSTVPLPCDHFAGRETVFKVEPAVL